jgi:hypothetical protein
MTPIAVRMVSAETMVGEGASFFSVVDSKQESESESDVREMYRAGGRKQGAQGPLK